MSVGSADLVVNSDTWPSGSSSWHRISGTVGYYLSVTRAVACSLSDFEPIPFAVKGHEWMPPAGGKYSEHNDYALQRWKER